MVIFLESQYCKDGQLTYWSLQAPFHSCSVPHGFLQRTNWTTPFLVSNYKQNRKDTSTDVHDTAYFCEYKERPLLLHTRLIVFLIPRNLTYIES